MKQIRLFAIILATALVAGVAIFYACTKDKEETVNNIADNLKKEGQFVVKNYDGSCVQVDVFRDEDNNAQFVTKEVPSDPNVGIVSIIPISLSLKLKSQQSKDGGGVVYEIPNDAIYWLVPLDGNKPVKFEPSKDAKTSNVSTYSDLCRCDWCEDCASLSDYDKSCETQVPVNGDPNHLTRGCKTEAGKCKKCAKKCTATTATATTVFVGSCYLVQSTTVTINSITYR